MKVRFLRGERWEAGGNAPAMSGTTIALFILPLLRALIVIVVVVSGLGFFA